MERVIRFLRLLAGYEFWGSITIHCERGKVTHVGLGFTKKKTMQYAELPRCGQELTDEQIKDIAREEGD